MADCCGIFFLQLMAALWCFMMTRNGKFMAFRHGLPSAVDNNSFNYLIEIFI